MKHNLHNNNNWEGQNPSPLTPKTRKGKETMNKYFSKLAGIFYKAINAWLSNEGADNRLIEAAYPNQDGKADHDAVAEMMALRDKLNSIANACQIGIEHLTETIEIYEENEK